MAVSTSGTFSDNGVSDAIAVKPGESIEVVLSVAGGEEFVGILFVERGNGVIWEPAVDVDGNVLTFDGSGDNDPLADDVCDAIVLNDTTKRQYYRVRCTEFDGDDAMYALNQVVGDVVEILLTGKNGEPVIGRRDDGGLKLYGPLAGGGDADLLELVGPIALSELVLSDPADPDNAFVSEKYVEVLLTAADIVSTDPGGFGHAAGFPLVPDPDAHTVIEFVSAVMVYDRVTATFGAGGNITINENGGAAVTGLISAANSVGAAADKIVQFNPLAAAARNMTLGKGLNLVAAAAFTNPGTAAGTIRVRVRYREHFTTL